MTKIMNIARNGWGALRRIPSPVGALLFVAGFYTMLKLIRPVIPHSVVLLYMGFVVAGVLIHLTLDDDRIRRFAGFFIRREGEPRGLILQRWGVLAFIPLVAAVWAYDATRPSYSPPVEIFLRHPQVAAEVLDAIQVPDWAANPEQWNVARIARGKKLYEGNCAVCHGEKLDGKGPAAEGFRYPIRPANFTDAGTISQLTLPYVYWRLTIGGIQNQFNSAMPAWVAPAGAQDPSSVHYYDLAPEEAWQIILYIYDATGFKPRSE